MRIAIIGVGRVGSCVAYNITTQGLCEELLLINRRQEIAQAEAWDLEHALPFADKRMRITAPLIEDVHNCDVIILSMSVSMKDVSSREQLGPDNAALYRAHMACIVAQNPKAIFVVVANPVDVLTYILIKEFNIPWQRIVGTGTLIDSARLRSLLAQEYDINPLDVRAYILGEHGDSQFVAYGSAQAGAESILKTERTDALFNEAVESGMRIYRAKGYTNFAIASAVAMILKSIAYDENNTLPLSILLQDYEGVDDVCLSVPVVLGRQGVKRVLHAQFSEKELLALQQSAQRVRSQIEQC